MLAEFETNAMTELVTICKLGKTMARACPACRCPHHLPYLLENQDKELRIYRMVFSKVPSEVNVEKKKRFLYLAFICVYLYSACLVCRSWIEAETNRPYLQLG